MASATSDVGGGTVLLKMADLNLVQVRTLVDETDIGKIQPGSGATVTVDAYPNRPFEGEVLKIEPLAETVQNVTMFPVLVRIENREGLLARHEHRGGDPRRAARQRARGAERGAPHPEGRASAAGVLGLSMEQVNTQLAAADQPPQVTRPPRARFARRRRRSRRRPRRRQAGRPAP